MTNYILSGDTSINGHFVINGIIYIAKTVESLNQIEDIDKYQNLSGIFDDITINGNFVICDFNDFDLICAGTYTSLETKTLM
jgi:hypothetical protein